MSADMPFAPPSLRVVGAFDDGAIEGGVVWLRGDHDAGNVAQLSQALAMAVAKSDGNLVIDVGNVDFMGASTIGALVGARNVLLSQSRDLVLRSPSRAVARLLDICGLTALIAPSGTRVDASLQAVGSG